MVDTSGPSDPTPAQAGTPTAAYPGQCLGYFGRSPREDSTASGQPVPMLLLKSSPSEINQAEVFYVTLTK